MKFLLKNSFIWRLLRKHKIIKSHKKVAEYWRPVIEQYYNGTLPVYKIYPKKNLSGKKIIWQYWGQGINSPELPPVVRICFASVDKYKGDYEVIRLSDDKINEFIELPQEVISKLRNGTFTRTAFSDLLRLALLTLYGGVWLDATILLTGTLPAKYTELSYFMFQRSPEVSNKSFWENIYAYYWGWNIKFRVNVLNSVIFSHPNATIISDLCNLMLYFWMNETIYPDYFTFQILYDTVINTHLKKDRCPIVSDTFPHLLQMKFNGHKVTYDIDEIMRLTPIHKMCYFNNTGLLQLRDFVKKYLEIY